MCAMISIPCAADSPLYFLLQNPQFTQLRGLVQQQPEVQWFD